MGYAALCNHLQLCQYTYALRAYTENRAINLKRRRYHLGVSFDDCFEEDAAEPGRAAILPNSKPEPPHDRFRECLAN